MLVIAHVPPIPHISTACIGLKLTYLVIRLECEAFQRRKSHTSVTAIAKFFSHLLGMSVIILAEAQAIT